MLTIGDKNTAISVFRKHFYANNTQKLNKWPSIWSQQEGNKK